MQEAPKMKRTHGQITAALKAEAKAQGKNPNDVYNQFFREAFLHELMQHQDGWVLKGGSNIYCRVPGARQTKDLDLYRQDDPTSSTGAAAALVAAMNGHRVGPYAFRVEHPDRTGAAGTVDSERIDVTVSYGVNRFLSFGVDVSGDLEATGTVEPLTVPASYEVTTEFLPHTFQVYSYPVASQIADKVCAMYERHGETPPGRASTRYHDLYDVALMARELTLSAADLRAALNTQCQVRKMTLPERLVIPDDSWATQYSAKAKKFGSERWGLKELDEALRVAGLLVDPVLSGELDGLDQSWDCAVLLWK
ncbi:nucleotidyl transferase AbiEii/AbiGii toxin family protein [Corynebacterium variabile]|uniref:nucleotidyl transferase AbiEii/AbiGii toxin family protein n=1 Tax=Corynebacterium variabile TaxID=1727 RepID=UPI003FD55B40